MKKKKCNKYTEIYIMISYLRDSKTESKNIVQNYNTDV